MGERPDADVFTIAFAGLATSHPFTDAASVLSRHPHARIHVWEREHERLNEFLLKFPSSTVHNDLESLAKVANDGVIVTVRPPEAAATVSAFVVSGVPLFINKPAAATLEQLAALDPVVRPISSRVLTSSVLRFAQPLVDVRAGLNTERVLSARATVRHDVGRWLRGSTAWQDEVLVGGGSIVTIGIHGIELLVSILGSDVEVVSAESSIRLLAGLKSEDVATIGLRWRNGVLGTVDLVGVAANETYALTIETADGPISIELPAADDDPFGYANAVDAFLGMVADFRAGYEVCSPVGWDETYAILHGVATAALLAHPRRPH